MFGNDVGAGDLLLDYNFREFQIYLLNSGTLKGKGMTYN